MDKKWLKLLEEGCELGSGNTFADLGLPHADRLQAKAYLRAAILARLRALKLTQVSAAARVGIPQPKISKLINDPESPGFTSDKLFDVATKLGLDVEIRIRVSPSRYGRIVVAPPLRRRKAAPKLSRSPKRAPAA
ncbi:MAG: XRE family transcriptional regulator [Candidatus Eremiobacteraeota bacterium]|nr:XRE family transcriptional regulator [Candidatus Eremiobacteraeota bacterium]